MNLTKSMLLVLSGAVVALAVALSCGNGDQTPDAHAQNDASSNCDCPAPPQPFEQRIRRIKVADTIAVEEYEKSVSANCVEEYGPDAIALWGGCGTPAGVNPAELRLATSYPFSDDTWVCRWRKEPGGNSYDLEAYVVCLLPEGTPPIDAGI